MESIAIAGVTFMTTAAAVNAHQLVTNPNIVKDKITYAIIAMDAFIVGCGLAFFYYKGLEMWNR